MAISKQEIKESLYYGKDKGYSHMAVICDAWDYTDFVVYIENDENIYKALKEYFDPNTLFKVMEIYNYNMNLESQLDEYRAYHIDADNKLKRKK